jgi:beta-lactamase regulating signal transducer with metallopeptidase domain
MIAGQSNFLEALGWAVLNSLWQMAILWMAYQLISGIFRKGGSPQKSYLATSLIITGFTWFVYTFFSILTTNTSGNDIIASGLINVNANERVNHWLNRMLPIASLVYLALLLFPVFYFIRNYRYVQAIRKDALTKVDPQWRIFVRNVAARMGIKKQVRVWLSGIVTSPVTIGYIKPIILLPVAAVNQLSTEQMEAVLLHELAHIRRYDYFINLVIRFIQTILYFNPFVKALVKAVEIEREKSCDEMVIQFQYDPHGYASALLMLETNNYLPKPLAVAASGKKSDLLQRIECMLGVQKRQVFSFNKLAGLFAGLLCFIALNALLIASRPGKNSNDIASLTDMSSPFYFFTDGDAGARELNPVSKPKEITTPSIVNHIQSQQPAAAERKEIKATNELPAALAHIDMPALPLTYVRFAETIAPKIRQLKNYQEEQVEEALDASKKVLEDKQWKDVEKRIADAMTSYEKDALKYQYDKELSKVDWNKMKEKLSTAYDKIDWNSVNDNLNTALTEMKIDSLRQVYSVAISALSTLQKELCENNLKGIPDTDVSLGSLEQGKINVQKAINRLQKVRTRKIVHL